MEREEINQEDIGTPEFVSRLQSRDQQAWRVLYTELKGQLRGRILKWGLERNADDIIQTILMEIFKGIDDFRGDSKFRRWLAVLIENQLKMAKRPYENKLKRTEILLGDPLELEGLVSDHLNVDIEDRDLDARRSLVLDEALGCLPPKQSKIIELHREGFTNKEIMDELKAHQMTVGSLLCQGLAELKDVIFYTTRFELLEEIATPEKIDEAERVRAAKEAKTPRQSKRATSSSPEPRPEDQT